MVVRSHMKRVTCGEAAQAEAAVFLFLAEVEREVCCRKTEKVCLSEPHLRNAGGKASQAAFERLRGGLVQDIACGERRISAKLVARLRRRRSKMAVNSGRCGAVRQRTQRADVPCSHRELPQRFCGRLLARKGEGEQEHLSSPEGGGKTKCCSRGALRNLNHRINAEPTRSRSMHALGATPERTERTSAPKAVCVSCSKTEGGPEGSPRTTGS